MQLPPDIRAIIYSMMVPYPPWDAPPSTTRTKLTRTATITVDPHRFIPLPPSVDRMRSRPVRDWLRNGLIQLELQRSIYTFEITPCWELWANKHIRLESIHVNPNKYYDLEDECPFDVRSLEHYTQLTQLTLVGVKEPVDLSTIAHSVPQLTLLGLRRLATTNLDTGLPRLKKLQILALEYVREACSFAHAEHLPELRSFTLFIERPNRFIECVDRIPHISRLQHLKVEGEWRASPAEREAALWSQLWSLQTFWSVRTPSQPWPVPWLMTHGRVLTDVRVAANDDLVVADQHVLEIKLSKATAGPLMCSSQLTVLHLGSTIALRDLRVIGQMTCLTSLQLMLQDFDVDCKPLRGLDRLQSLEVTRGRVLSFVPWLRSLETLHCIDDLSETNGDCDRMFDKCDEDHGGVMASVRRLVLHGRVLVAPACVSRLRYVEQIEIRHHSAAAQALESVVDLPNVKRLSMSESVDALTQLPRPLACVSHLEELWVRRKSSVGPCYHGALMVPLPPWLAYATKLRVLAVPSVDPKQFTTCGFTSLERLYVPCYILPGHGIAYQSMMRSLKNLRIVALPKHVSCEELRSRGPQSTAPWFPHLHCILHPTVDCLWTEKCWVKETGTRLNQEQTIALLPDWTSEFADQKEPLNPQRPTPETKEERFLRHRARVPIPYIG